MERKSNSSIMNSNQRYAIECCAVLVIAAGESKRMGRPKQLLEWEGETLINRITKLITNTLTFPVYLVLGANAKSIQSQLPIMNVNIVINDQWKQGMSSSIKTGLLAALSDNKDLKGVLMVVCDQPYIDGSILKSLMELQIEKDTPMAAAYYNNVIGTPALFHQSIFNDLLSLEGDVGAKRIIQSRPEEVAKLHFEAGLIDIDTIEDYQKLLKQIGNHD